MTNDYGNLELHTVLLAAMKDIDKICRENGLKYYLHAGTLLGAFNHKGFIPWDDDVDISLMRRDYDKFMQIMAQDYADRYFVQTYETDPNHTNNRGVLRILGTKVSHIHGDKPGVRQEVAIDIVPLYPVPESKLLRKFQQAWIWILDMAVQIKQGSVIPHHPVMKSIGLLARRDRVKLGKDIDRAMRMCKNDASRDVGILCYTHRNPYMGRSGYDNEIWPRSWYAQPMEILFEGEKFLTISEPEAYFNFQYGPKWADPYPEEKRITKHDVKSYEISPEVRARVGL